MNNDALKQALIELPHVQTVWLDQDGQWYFTPYVTTTSSYTRDEILGKVDAPAEEVKKKK